MLTWVCILLTPTQFAFIKWKFNTAICLSGYTFLWERQGLSLTKKVDWVDTNLSILVLKMS